jgi:hypothetical protein
MSRAQREKGKRGERAWRDVLRAALADAGLTEYADAVQRGARQSRDGSDAPDVLCPYLWSEVKAGARPPLLAALDQAQQAQAEAAKRDPVSFATATPIAACRFDGSGRTAARWVVLLDGHEFATMYAEWLARGER